ncbi:flagellar hook-associated protein FlgK [Lacipirellula limnantheis]|uniref:Flagellar hook-associated protein 1 n=1 Tax=Lacipirellula limnantheis TaxID=2528024 RepID=A0A517TV80_9BACT|nr:flagellar hook-associated protein FlgK [Lacipirellula limnantheis]QDT72285.1 Flagellar hook-associated protein 1 [Lacipirellula limnantheis]
MSIFGSIQMAGNTLQAMEIGLHVVGNNIANANTPGYIRERVLYAPAPVQKLGNLTLGLGVEIAGIVQNIDGFIEDRLRGVAGDRASSEIQEKVYRDLESIIGELSDTDVSTQLTNFFNSIDEVVNQPEEMSVRNLAVQAGKTLATTINTLSSRVNTAYEEFGIEVNNLTSEINTLTEQVRKLNVQIVSLEGGNPTASQAGALRSQRGVALKRLAEIADVSVTENKVGAVNVTVGGELLVFEGTARQVKTDYATSNGRPVATIQFAENNSPLYVSGGELHGIYEARDTIVGGFLDRLDEFAGALANEFNKVYSQGQGATGFQSVTSQEAVSDPALSLDAAGLPFTPVNGQFKLLVYNTTTKLTETHTINVDLDGLQDDTSLASLVNQINGIVGVNAQVTADNRLKLSTESAETRLAFADDTSGLLAAIGINSFFTGSNAATLSVNDVVAADGSKFAASSQGIGVNVENAQRLIALHDGGLASLNGGSITGLYDQLINEVAQGATVAGSKTEGFKVFEQTLQANAQAVSGVNLDEEAIDMIMLQRTYQASARYISTLSDLMDILVSL